MISRDTDPATHCLAWGPYWWRPQLYLGGNIAGETEVLPPHGAPEKGQGDQMLTRDGHSYIQKNTTSGNFLAPPPSNMEASRFLRTQEWRRSGGEVFKSTQAMKVKPARLSSDQLRTSNYGRPEDQMPLLQALASPKLRTAPQKSGRENWIDWYQVSVTQAQWWLKREVTLLSKNK